MKSIRFRRLGSLPFGGIPHAVLAAAFVAIYLFPIYWMFISGLKSSSEIFANPPTFVPRQPTLAAFEYVFVRENVLRYLRNSLTIAIPVTLLTLLMGSMGAYAMSRLRGRLVDVALVLVLLLQVFPEALLATPMFIIFKSLDILNTFLAVILATTSKTLSFALVILRPMFRQVPIELEEALLRRWLHAAADLPPYRLADHARAADRRWHVELRPGLRPVRLRHDPAQPTGTAARNCRNLQLRWRGVCRLAPGDGVLVDFRPADPDRLPLPAAPHRLGSDRRRIEVSLGI